MAGYWLKLYTEILDDIKYYRLSNDAKLAMYELMLVAKRTGDTGLLPTLDEIIFVTHGAHDESWWKNAITELRSIRFLEEVPDGEKIRTFEERQAAIDATERSKKYREIRNKPQRTCNDDATEVQRNVMEKEREINRENTDTDKKDKKDVIAPVISSDPDKKQVDAWNFALGDLQRDIPKQEYESYINNLKLQGVEGNVFKVRAVNQPTADRVMKRYGSTLNYAIQGYYGQQTKLEVTV